MNIRFIIILFTLILFGQKTFAQKVQYRDDLFSKIDTLKDIQYGEALNLNYEIEKLTMDIFLPLDDPSTIRPLLIGIHGGGFVNGNKSGGFPVEICMKVVKKGFVTASINYRKGVAKPRTDTTYYEAMLRAVQDTKAAIRYFRKNAALYGIDTSKIFLMGSSAGSMIALNVAYLDANELPSFINAKTLGNLEGNSGNPGYASNIHGIINGWGALTDLSLMQTNNVPIFSIHGTEDKTVPFDDSFSYHGFGEGSKKIHERALNLGINSKLRLFENAGHTPLKGENGKIAERDVFEWLFERMK